MRIYRMTATFGKLEHETLELKPGLNIITAPNEWGKSTWCAFLVAMLYGIDTRAKTTKNALADKERYAPWSGAPMAGRIDLNWNGRDITIERKTRRRVPLGDFRAYETATGIAVEELNASNCGSVLLGVEQSVFRRAGFIRHADLPVTQDEALRRRLNALVTTGDDSGAADRLADSLKELKNRCRYNRSGLLPQAEARRDALEDKLAELETLEAQTKKVQLRLEDIKTWLSQLYNHQQTLAYRKMEADIARVSKARESMEQAERLLARQQEVCEGLPSREEAERKARELRSFREQWNAIQAEVAAAPTEPQVPAMTGPFAGMTEEAAREMVNRDAKLFNQVSESKMPSILIFVGLFGILAAGVLLYLRAYVFAGIAAAAGLAALTWGMFEKVSARKQRMDLLDKYGDANWQFWAEPIEAYVQQLRSYQSSRKEYDDINEDLEVRLMVLRNKRDAICGNQDPDTLLDSWQNTLKQWETLEIAQREAAQTRNHFEALSAMVKPVAKPEQPDVLNQTEEETARLVSECAMEQQRLQNRLGQYQGRMENLGDRESLLAQLKKVQDRIVKLEDTYAALVIAQETLSAARTELQRRFAPRITRRAQALLSAMTGGRYHSLTMGTDFSLQAGAGEEETLCDALWRSDGTMDQLYLALRLAVAEELTPEAPLILDDVLVRFDDSRMKAAVKLLQEMAKDKQVICFTCQEREKQV